MLSIVFAFTPDTYDTLVEQLWAHGTTGIIEGNSTLEAFFETDPSLAHLNPLNITQTENIDWEQYTKDSFPPVVVGERFFLAPPWCEDPTPPGRMRLVVNPGLACGTGYHPCTHMCLDALERHLKPGMRLLDVGGGSGILSLAATHLGAHPVACDIDPDAMPYCDTPLKFVGSTAAVKAHSFDAIVANISAATNLELWPEYREIAPLIVVSGFQDDEFTPPSAPFEHLERDGWHCYVFRL